MGEKRPNRKTKTGDNPGDIRSENREKGTDEA
jgi:hypothetical protein